MIIPILLVILIFSLLVFVHEFGHFITARKGGIEVEEFGFGFPPRLWGIKRGGTLYSINLIPFGGFVRMKGEDSADTSPGSFGAAGTGRKMAVLLAGVGMNLLVAYVLFVYLAATGLPGNVSNDLNLPAPQSETPKQVIVLNVAADSPAAAAGIRKGDAIISANGEAFEDEQELVEYNKLHAGLNVTYVVERGNGRQDMAITLRSGEVGEKEGYLGVTPLVLQEVRYGWNAPLVAAEATGKAVWLTVTGFAGSMANMFTKGEVAEGVAGPVGIVALLGGIMHLGLSYVLIFVITISISLAIFNVLPIPALDGGRVAILAVGKLIGRPVPPKVEGAIHAAGFILLLLAMLAITVKDIQGLM